MKRNGKAKVYNMKGGDTPRADLRPMLIDYPNQDSNINKPLIEIAAVIKGIAVGQKKQTKRKTRKNKR